MIPSTVKDVFLKGFMSVREDDTLSSSLSLFKEEMPPVLVVLDRKGRYKGVLARRWIIRSSLDLSITKVKTLMRTAPTVKLYDSLSMVARLMIESEIRQLPVYSGKKLLGFITDEDIIHRAVMEEWGNTKVVEIMTKKPYVVEEDESVGGVLSLFRGQDISHAPVVRNGKILGMISIHDIIEYLFQPRQRLRLGDRVGEKVKTLSSPVKAIMVKPVITVLPETALKDAEKKMHEFEISSLVVTINGKLVGILTKRDFLEPIAQMEKVRRELTIQFSLKDIEIDEVQRGFIIDEFESFAKRYEETLEGGTLFIYMKTHGTNYKGDRLIHCRLQLRTRKGSFFSSSEGWGEEQTFRMALDRLERQILRSKEFEYDREFARTYLRRIRFPQTEL
ncbi:MAG: CBS domain-containing protein [Candidatus Methylarchaceae archaeon HK01B]|nr:CBS domain-containing protein [Candidatus Methylarchaceae archaeon HK01B]